MDCRTTRDIISARIDGETVDPPDGDLVDTHLAACSACRSYQEGVYSLRRSTTVRPVEGRPDVTAAVMARLSVPDTGTGEWIRYLLGSIGLTLALLNLPLLVTARSADAEPHMSRHLGAFGLALGAGLLFAAVRPERAMGLLPLAGALGAAMTAGAIADLAGGESALLAEATHLLELAGLALLWALSGGRHRLANRVRSLPRRAPLRAV